MKNFLFIIATLLILSSCHRPVALFQRTPHLAAARLSVNKSAPHVDALPLDSILSTNQSLNEISLPEGAIANRSNQPAHEVNVSVQRRMHKVESFLVTSVKQSTVRQPDPKPKKKLKLGNRIRQGLGLPLRKELNWWQRISWKLKASVIIILVAVVFAILHITVLSIIFGILGAFLMISGLRKSFKVRRPWL